MKAFIKDLITYKNIFWLLYIVLYFVYVAINMSINRGNYIINIALLIVTSVYFLLYIYSAFIENDKRMKRRSKKVFVRTRKLLVFINACMILTSVISNNNNSFFTIFFATIAILWYLLYLFVDIASSIALTKFRSYSKEGMWKRDRRN